MTQPLIQSITDLEQALNRRPFRLSITIGRRILGHLQEYRKALLSLSDLREIEERYTALVKEYNQIWELASRLGIRVYQPMGEEFGWGWEYHRGEHGLEDTPIKALYAALEVWRKHAEES